LVRRGESSPLDSYSYSYSFGRPVIYFGIIWNNWEEVGWIGKIWEELGRGEFGIGKSGNWEEWELGRVGIGKSGN
jgi:hypothetical protein